MITLTKEQQKFIDIAKSGCNILVDACIGSGKTTAIQELCKEISSSSKRILYLTFNAFLKDDARRKIQLPYVKVYNYNGFAYYWIIKAINKKVSPQEQIKAFSDIKPKIDKYDVLIIDEYQDIETDHAKLLKYIKSFNPNMQIIMVGDMGQKVYNYTTLDVTKFIKKFLGKYKLLEFTRCFRLNEKLAAQLGRIWEKEIIGVNKDCKVQIMSIDEVVDFLSKRETGEILCLGSNKGVRVNIQNKLEELDPYKFNKDTIYATISDDEEEIRTCGKKITDDTAIFCTYDKCKGMERDICIVTDFTEEYWRIRAKQPNQEYETLRNRFLVAASRGKKHIIFVEDENNTLIDLDGKTLSTPFEDGKIVILEISKMYDYKNREDIEEVYSCLDIEPIKLRDTSEIKIKNTDGFIDLSPCIGIYQELMFFDVDVDKYIDYFFKHKKTSLNKLNGDETLEEKTLFITALDTGQNRYINQVEQPFITEFDRKRIYDRLSTVFNSKYEEIQLDCIIPFCSENGNVLFIADGFLDVYKEGTVYELKFVSALSKKHFLQSATYAYAIGNSSSILWNTKTNEMFKVRIKDKKQFSDAMTKAVTKGRMTKYYGTTKKVDRLLDHGKTIGWYDNENFVLSQTPLYINKKST